MNQLILGDNLEIMRKMDSETIDLIYLDPPFFSNRNYEVIWGDKGEVRSFEDRWSGGIDHYIAWLKERVAEMHRLLKPTGSIYLHCDWHADAYIRVYILDKIFGANNFRNEIIWHYRTGNLSKHQFQKKHDNILIYSKSDNFTYNPIEIKEYYSQIYGPETKIAFKGRNHGTDKYGDFRISFVDDVWDISAVFTLSKEHIGYPTQKPVKLLERIILASSNEGDIVFDPFVGGGTTIVVADKLNRNWIGIDQSVQAVKVSEMRLNNQQNLFSSPFSVQLHKYDYDTLRFKDAFEFESWIITQFGGQGNLKQRGDLGMDGKTREGTPIQVKRSDNIGRNVIDNFQSACKRWDNNLFEKNRKAGLPVGHLIAFSFAKGTIQEAARLQNEENIIIKLVTVEEIVPIAKKPKLTVTLRDLGTVNPPATEINPLTPLEQELNPLTPLEQGGTKTGKEKGIPLSQRGKKGVLLREIEFIATGVSDAGIEFYSWDFDYEHTPLIPLSRGEKDEIPPLSRGGQGVCQFKPSILLDKEGKQTHKFKPGTHSIAVKAVDNEGLEAIEVVRVKVNGEVERE